MHYGFCLVFALLPCCTGESMVHGSPQNVLTFEGEFVILPCSFTATPSSDIPTVEWSKEGLVPNVVFLYRDGYETAEMKNSEFEYRTNLFTKELQNGNISLRISNVQLSDSGTYRCMRIWKDSTRDITTVELLVDAVSNPKISVVSAECNEVTLECEANYLLAEPEIMFLDDQGNDIPPEDPNGDEDDGECCTVRRRATLQIAANSITCRVHKQESNLVRDTEILILADCTRSPFLITGGAIFSLVFVCGLAFCLLKKSCTSAEGQNRSGTRRVSVQSTLSITIDRLPLEQVDGADDNLGNSVVEMLTRELALLKLQLQERDQTIRCLSSHVAGMHTNPVTVCCASISSLDVSKPFIHSLGTSMLTSNHIQNLSNNNPLKPANIGRNKGPMLGVKRQPIPVQRRNSSPAVLSPVLSSSSSASRSKKKLCRIGRSMSEPQARPDLNLAKHQFRYSSGIPANLSANRYTLVDVKEESEPLIACENSPQLHF